VTRVQVLLKTSPSARLVRVSYALKATEWPRIDLTDQYQKKGFGFTSNCSNLDIREITTQTTFEGASSKSTRDVAATLR
jgi:hypothetical protein